MENIQSVKKGADNTMQSLIRIAAISPKVHIGNVDKNVKEIVELLNSNDRKVAASNIIVTPELSLTGYTAQDMFMNKALINKFTVYNLLDTIKPIMRTLWENSVIVLGAPIVVNGSMYNCAILASNTGILGIVPKCHIPNYSEFYEKRWFTGAYEKTDYLNYLKLRRNGELAYEVPFGPSRVFEFNNVKIGIEICEDLWAPNPPSVDMCLAGAEIIINCSASNETIGKAEYRRNLVSQQSARCIAAYVYCSAGSSESTSDVVFSGHSIIAENGSILEESKLFDENNSIIKTDIDLDRLRHDRIVNKTFSANSMNTNNRATTVRIYKSLDNYFCNTVRNVSITPFIPSNNIMERCKSIFDIQVEGLARRWRHTGSSKLVIGISGGLDSTLALLVVVGAADKLGFGRERILGVTMPCFGTTDLTKNNALALMKELGCSVKEVNIEKSVKQHLKDIGLSEDDRSIAYENAQARERTQVLMDIANMVGGFVVGTGDLSELALGWCTYNGDHMSMYNVNSSIPKTLVRAMVQNVGYILASEYDGKNIKNESLWDCIKSIIDTPISPELLPPDKDGNMLQLTEDSIGPYILNDFFLYYTLRFGMNPTKIYELAKEAVRQSDKYKFSNNEIKRWLKKFYTRFAKAQFKRNCCPDGVKVGSVSFSPRGDWRMPTEFDIEAYITEIDSIEN